MADQTDEEIKFCGMDPLEFAGFIIGLFAQEGFAEEKKEDQNDKQER